MLVVFLVLAVLCLGITMGVAQQPHRAEKGLGEGSSMGFSLCCCPEPQLSFGQPRCKWTLREGGGKVVVLLGA